jgi:hypothetical protein
MNMIDRVAELKEMEAKAEPDWKVANVVANGIPFTAIYRNSISEIALFPRGNESDARLAHALRNAAPAMLDILGETRPGDSDSLLYIIENILGDDIEDEISKDVLRRYQAMARKMEGESL